jgi:hypothetical protein
MTRIFNAIKIAVWAYKNPSVLQEGTFVTLSNLLALILKTASEHRPMMSDLAVVHPTGEKDAIVKVWCGVGAASSPMKRIQELIEENNELKRLLANEVKKQAA